MDIKIRWILVHICYEYDKCSDIFFIFFLTYYHHVIFRFLQGRIDGNKPTFHRCRWDFYCSVCLSFLYVCVRAFMCKNRQSDQMISVEVPTCFASNALFSFWQLDAFLSLFFAVKALCALFLSVLHIKKKYIYIYFCICKSYCFPLQWRRTFNRRQYTKTLYKKRKKNTLDQNFFLSFCPSFWFFLKQQKKKEENTMTIMKIYFVRFYITRDWGKKEEKILRQKTYETMNSCYLKHAHIYRLFLYHHLLKIVNSLKFIFEQSSL
jgi:hypothetical protein